jgi:hypothetical protein
MPCLPLAQDTVTAHWFYRLPEAGAAQEVWRPFSLEDSTEIEAAVECGGSGPVPVEGTRWDVDTTRRVARPVYWAGEEREVRVVG